MIAESRLYAADLIGADLSNATLIRATLSNATLFRAADKSAGVFSPLGPALSAIHRRLKRAFDPDGLFNPGRQYPEL